jgi:hypothetical protein
MVNEKYPWQYFTQILKGSDVGALLGVVEVSSYRQTQQNSSLEHVSKFTFRNAVFFCII